MLLTEYRRDLTATVALVLLLSGLLVAYFGPTEISLRVDNLWNIATAYLLFAAGPIAGWLLATLGGAIFPALWSLIPLTFLSVWPAVRAARTTNSVFRRIMLAVAGSFWLFSSTFYLVLMWG
jgi:hypothetical protein